MSESLVSHYDVDVAAPFECHIFLFWRDQKDCQNARSNEDGVKVERNVLDLRESYLQRLVVELESVNWRFLYAESLSLDDKCIMFNSIMGNIFKKCIPSKQVMLSKRDKPCISPYIKMLIHNRWSAFRNRDWQLFNHLKVKIRSEIAKAKRRWIDKAQTNDI